MRIFIPIVMLLLALLLVIFGAQNTQAVNIHFLNMESGWVSLALVVVIAAIFGAVLTGLFGLWIRIRYGIQNWRANKQRNTLESRNTDLEQRITALEQENAKLREAAPAAPPSAPATSKTAQATEQKAV